jgi:hypothetical protein
MNPVFLVMAIASLVVAVFSPWWVSIIALYCAYGYLNMSAEY